jgi:hypothetical protein
VTDTARFIATTIGGVICIALAVCAYLTPPVLALGDPLRVLLLTAGIGAFGIQIATGYQAARVSAAVKARGRAPLGRRS